MLCTYVCLGQYFLLLGNTLSVPSVLNDLREAKKCLSRAFVPSNTTTCSVYSSANALVASALRR